MTLEGRSGCTERYRIKEIGPHLLTLRFDREQGEKRFNLFLILAVLFSSFSLFVLQVIAVPPHVLLIVLDDLGWSDVGFDGSQINTTNMDKLNLFLKV